MSGAIVLFLSGCIKTTKTDAEYTLKAFCNTYEPIDYKTTKKWASNLGKEYNERYATFVAFIKAIEENYQYDDLFRTKQWQDMVLTTIEHFQSYEMYMVQASLNNDIYNNIAYYNQLFETECKKSPH